MKRWIVVVALLSLVLTSTAVVFAGPINVGGSFSASFESSKDIGPKDYKGKGNPNGKPFLIPEPEADFLLAPINVGGS